MKLYAIQYKKVTYSMPQYTFTSTKELIEEQIEEIRLKERRSRSEMIDILLRQAINERNRKKKKRVLQENSNLVQ